MATIYGSLTSYVAEGYVADGYVVDSRLQSTFSTSITAELNPYIEGECDLTANFTQATGSTNTKPGALSVDASFTQTTASAVTYDAALELDGSMSTSMTANAIFRPSLYLDAAFDMTAVAAGSIEATAEWGLITNWSALGSPTWAGVSTQDASFTQTASATHTLGAELSLSATFTQDTTATNQTNAVATFSYDFTQDVDSSVAIEAASDVDASFTQTTESGLLFDGVLDVDASFTTDGWTYRKTLKTMQQIRDYFIDIHGDSSYSYAGQRYDDYGPYKFGNSSGTFAHGVQDANYWTQSGILTDVDKQLKLGGDFTIECFAHAEYTENNEKVYLMSTATQLYDLGEESANANYNTGFEFKFDTGTSNYTDITLVFRDQGHGDGLQYLVLTKSITTALDTWKHYAVTRSGSDISVFIDGTLQTGWSINETIDGVGQTPRTGNTGSFKGQVNRPTTNETYNDETKFIIGDDGRWESSSSYSWNGWIDEIRISNKDYSNSGASFTVPTSAYETDHDYDALLLHCESEVDNFTSSVDFNHYDIIFRDDNTVYATTTQTATFTQDTTAINQTNGILAVDGSFTHNTWAQNQTGFTTACYTWDSLPDWASWDEWSICQEGIGLASVDFGVFTQSTDANVWVLHAGASDLTASFTQSTDSYVQHLATYEPSAAFNQNTNTTLNIYAVSDQDSEFTQTVVAENLIEAELDLTTVTSKTTLAINVISAICNMSASFTQTTDSYVDTNAIVTLDATFTQTAVGTTDLVGQVQLSSNFTQSSDSGVQHTTPLAVDATFTVNDITVEYTAGGIITWDSSLTQDTVPHLIVGPTINLSATFTQETDYEGYWAGEVFNFGDFTLTTVAENLIEATLPLTATFTQDTDADIEFGLINISNPFSYATTISAEVTHEGIADLSSNFTLDPVDYTYFAAGTLDVSATFTVTNAGAIIPVSLERTLYVCQETRTINVYYEDRTLEASQETRVLAA